MQGDVLNHFLLVVSIMAFWVVGLYYMGGKQVFWEYSQFPDESKH